MKLKISALLTLALLTLPLSSALSSDDQGSSHYSIKLKLDPPSQHLKVSMKLNVVPAETLSDTLVFALHRQFMKLDVVGDGVESFSFDMDAESPNMFMPDARPLNVVLDKSTARNEPLTLSFDYEGTLTEWSKYSANVVTEDWVELGLYIPWIPLGKITGLFTFDIEAECDPEYQLRSYGDHRYENGIWYFERTTPTFDCILVASKDLKTLNKKAAGKNVYLHYQALADTTAEKFVGDLSGIFDMFESWYGGSSKGNDFTLITSPREMGGGYARGDLITMTWINDEKYVTDRAFLYRYLAHETGHFWWGMAEAVSWEDWLNESFAEYSAQLAVRETLGEDVFESNMEKYRIAAESTVPIWGFDRTATGESGQQSPVIHTNLYQKGPVLLHKLSERIGIDNFKSLCKNMVQSKTSTTEAFLLLLESRQGAGVRNWFENLLKTY